MTDGLSREFLAERDLRIFDMKKSGTSTVQIAKRFGITTKAVQLAVARQLERLQKEALTSYPLVLRMELERLDAMQQALWPQTQMRQVEAPDGTKMMLEPDVKVVQQVLAIMDRRSKLLGMDSVRVALDIDRPEPLRATLADATDQSAAVDAFNPETEARQLMQLMGQAGVLPSEFVDSILLDDDPLPALEAAQVEVLTP